MLAEVTDRLIAVMLLVALFLWLHFWPFKNIPDSYEWPWAVVTFFGLGSYWWLKGYEERGRTSGKEQFGLRICDATTGKTIDKWRAFLRWIISLAMLLIPLLALADIFWPLWDSRGQALHDKMMNTLVVKDAQNTRKQRVAHRRAA